MPKYVTIGYGDQEGYDRTAAAIRDAAHAHDAKLQKDGVLMGIAGTQCKCVIPMLFRLKRRMVHS